jgi:hypothetical protein
METLRHGPGHASRRLAVAASIAFLAGGLLVVWSGYIHYDLWHNVGYRHIPTIGPLFLLQSIAGLIVGLLIIAVRRVWVAVVGAGFAASTMAGFLISEQHGLFGFKDVWSSPFAHEAFLLEAGTIGVLALAAVLCLVGSPPNRPSTTASTRTLTAAGEGPLRHS